MPLQPLHDKVIPLHRWYPYGRDNHAWPFAIEPAADRRPPIVRYALAHGAGTASMESAPLDYFVSHVRMAIPAAREKHARLAAVAGRNGYSQEVVEQTIKTLNELEDFAAGRLPLPESSFESKVSADVVVRGRQQGREDYWGYIDGLTGGCCNYLGSTVTGEHFYGATWSGDALTDLASDAELELLAVELRMSSECSALLTTETRKVLANMPTVAEFDAQIKLAHENWIDGRKEALIRAIKNAEMSGGRELVLPTQFRFFPDFTKNTIDTDCEYREPGDDMPWRVAVTAQYDPAGHLLFVRGHDRIRSIDVFRADGVDAAHMDKPIQPAKTSGPSM